MTRIEQKFSDLRKKNEKGLITFITAGHTDASTTESLMLKMQECGADIIELGVPFSDPSADGPVIQKSNGRALKNGASLKKIIESVHSIRKKTDIPIVLMSSYNPIYFYGEEKFTKDAASSGVDGVIIPDLPLEEGENQRNLADKSNLNMINLIAPTTSDKRTYCIAKRSKGFIYYISFAGITGTEKNFSEIIFSQVEKIKKYSSLPVAVGFGIKKPEHAKAVCRVADAAIVGSALVSLIENNLNNKKSMVEEVGNLTRRLKQGCNE